MMDISYWSNISPGIKIQETTKKYFKRFLWRLEIRAEGGRLLDYKIRNLAEALEHRRSVAKMYNYGGSWFYHRHQSNLNNVDLELLSVIRDIKTEYAGQIRIRVEEPSIQFYAEDESTLKSIAQRLQSKNCIENITGPTPKTKDLLDSGAIITRSPIDYEYKVIIRDGRYTAETKHQILTYLDGLGDVIKLSKACRESLTKHYPSVWSVFFYTKDPDIVTFLSFIHPDLISNIHRLVNVEE